MRGRRGGRRRVRRGRESRGADEAPHPSGRASRGGAEKESTLGKNEAVGRHFWWSRPFSSSRARDAEKKTRVSARAAGGGRRGSRVAGARTSAIAAEPPFWEASPGFATPASAWSAIYAWGSAARGGRAPVRPVGYVSIAALAPFSFFFPTPSARRTGGRTRGRGRRAPGSPRARRVSTAGSLGRASRAGPAASASGVGARGASRERLARGDGRRVGGFASPPILRARASEEPFLPAGPRRAPPPPPRPRRPRARVCSACALALARVRRAVRVARPLASARAGAQCARGRARCSHHASNALLPFPRRVGSVPFVHNDRCSRSGVGGRGAGSKILRCSVWNFCVPSASARIGESANISSSF